MRKDISYGRYLPLTLIPLGLLVYSSVLKAPFVYDDKGYITGNLWIRSLSNLADLSGTRYAGFASFALNYAAGGLNPFDFHLTNILIHTGNSLLIFYIVRLSFSTPSFMGKEGVQRAALPAAFLSSVIFLVHPIESQAVSYVTQRFASLAALFYLLAIFLYIKARLAWISGKGDGRKRGWAFYIGSLASTVLAMKTKEISFTLPLAVVLYEIVFFRDDFRRWRYQRIPYYLTLLIIPLTLFGPDIGIGGSENLNVEHLRGLQLNEASVLPRDVYLFTQFRVVVTYLRLIFYPAGQSLEYDYRVSTSVTDPAAFISLLFLASLAAFSVFILIKSFRNPDIWSRLFSFGILFFFIALTVESSLIPIQDVIFEHRAYLPSAGIIIASIGAVFYAFDYFKARLGKDTGYAAPALVLFLSLTPPLSAALYARNMVWCDEMLLLNDSISKAPGNARLYYARGLLYFGKKDYGAALTDAGMILSLKPGIAEAYNLKGLAYAGLGRYEDSIASFTSALSINRDYEAVYLNRAISYAAIGRHAEALSGIDAAARYPETKTLLRTAPVLKAFAGVMESCGKKEMKGCEWLR